MPHCLIPPVNLPIVGPAAIDLDKDHIYGLGMEGNIFIPSIRSAFVLRWVGELGAAARFQEATFVLMWVYSLKSFAHHKE